MEYLHITEKLHKNKKTAQFTWNIWCKYKTALNAKPVQRKTLLKCAVCSVLWEFC